MPFKLRIPPALGSSPRTGVYVKEETSAASPTLPATGQVYADYGDVGVVEYAASPKDTAQSYAAAESAGTDSSTYSHPKVNGIPAAAESRGTYQVLDNGRPVTVEHGGSKVVWIQDGVIISVTSTTKTWEELLPLAEVVSTTAVSD